MTSLKPVVWMRDSLKALKAFPAVVQREVGYAVELAQRGGKHVEAKPLKGLEAVEMVSDFDGDTFRAVYTVKFAGYVYVLHCFQKKSRHGIATPQSEIDLIKRRLRDAKEHFQANR